MIMTLIITTVWILLSIQGKSDNLPANEDEKNLYRSTAVN